uniref:3-ketoacyl-CoA synthase n=1 Tax=Rhizochromulina marina TaxID=1034831 RepID=A0A7S2WTL4_9STRA|mmetsp:Transcript_4308/g.12813  ORF Transcript_4308/g.12813 Transcript_4308/m.12813 type:complete len:520 (+) Transcript_4308:42-1601(+)|eukprot:CAMPEP_0118974098 /NCGR_PEP_ID=MMETSP1173-20130426/11070_1 /TAXON_ID=1034831 /ORGANISM="Rhizochromulina marina cf, Strain CCMP1243" /LENGTH=519 /DNA_ID=CAMNT_0006923803 /DNA_START=42 /DNA_END=1601 /DNA_ORIENTATION=+
MPADPASQSSDSETNANDTRVYKVRKSRLISLVNWYHVVSTFFPWILIGLVALLVVQFSFSMYQNRGQVEELIVYTVTGKPEVWFLGWQGTFLTLTLVYLFARRERQVYLLDFCTWEPPADWKVSHAQLIEIMRRQACFTEESLNLMGRVLAKSGTGQATAWPPSILESMKTGKPQNQSVENARAESERVICDCIRDVLDKTKTQPKDVDILIINCSLFSPTPSLCALAAHNFGMRKDILSYNLSGMGCSASVLAVDLAKNLLRSRPNSIALVVSTENLTQNLYRGNERMMLIQNTLFRCGGAAMILSNRFTDSLRAKYKLLHAQRLQGTDDESYESVFECEDSEGNHGVRLSKKVPDVAGRAMEQNLTALGPHVLPLSEMIKVGRVWGLRFLTRRLRVWLEKNQMTKLAKYVPVVAPYVPDFKRGIDHFCIHAGGRKVVDDVAANLKLSEDQTQPSRDTLYNYGNTSSSSIWYELSFIRHHMKQKRGQRVLQISFGSGFKCNTAVWLCLKDGEGMRKK